MTTEELLPCPFCGAQPSVADRADAYTDTGHIWFIACFCGGNSARAHQYGSTKEKAYANWNRRARLTESTSRFVGLGDALAMERCAPGVEGRGEEVPEVSVGQIWRVVNPQVTRMVKVVGIQGDKVALRGTQTNRLSYASKSRFHGQSGGYAFVDEPQPSIHLPKISDPIFTIRDREGTEHAVYGDAFAAAALMDIINKVNDLEATNAKS